MKALIELKNHFSYPLIVSSFSNVLVQKGVFSFFFKTNKKTSIHPKEDKIYCLKSKALFFLLCKLSPDPEITELEFI